MGNSLGFIVTWMKFPSTIMCFSSDVVRVQLLWTVVKMAGQGSREMAQRLRVTVNQLQRTAVQFSNTLISQFTTACNSNSREPDTSDGLCALNTNKRLPFKNRAGQILPEWLYRERDLPCTADLNSTQREQLYRQLYRFTDKRLGEGRAKTEKYWDRGMGGSSLTGMAWKDSS